MLKSKDIRRQFIEFFQQKGHTFMPSAPVIPQDDPTLLFTNAGMNQFKDIFLGNSTPKYSRVVNSQKCIRAGGKHNDLDDVGKDSYHHTFFEMLGNWSFADYYKTEAITWAWELLSQVWGLPKDKLHATVYKDDDEAEELWKTLTDIDHSHITRHGEKDNFWEMGETGPCGPCSEIHIDRGQEFCNLNHLPDHKCRVNGDCHRYIELWNLVFIQFQRHEDRSLTPLKNKYIDTGAGFERLCQVLQGKSSNYDTDVFTPLLTEIAKMSGNPYSEAGGMAHRVIADHIRTLCFAITDGGMPSNEGRGYVLRRILRRAVRYGKKLNLNEPFMYKLVDCVVETMGEAFPELTQRSDLVKTIIKEEETRFLLTLDKGLTLFAELVSKLQGKVISGQDAFTLYDTYGFPLDLTMILAEEQGLTVDTAGFEQEMGLQRQRARKASQFKLASGDSEWVSFHEETPTEFLGYETLTCTANVIKYCLLEEGKVKVVFDKTPFYAESGGQIGDTGCVGTELLPSVINVFDVKKEGDAFVHYGTITGEIADSTYTLTVDKHHRQKVARNHTATHLLHKALKQVLGEHINQKGSLVSSNGFRFDFTHYSAMTADEIAKVEHIVNEQIWQCHAVTTQVLSMDEAKKSGAIALFDEKYGDVVRVVSVGDFSKELCGGTHVANAGGIGFLKILTEASSAAGVRRIEAITSEDVEGYIQGNDALLATIYATFSANKKNLLTKIEKLIQDHKDLEHEVEALRKQTSTNLVSDLLSQRQNINGINCVYSLVKASNPDELKALADQLREGLQSGIIVLVAEIDSKVTILVVVTKDLCNAHPAGKIVAKLAEIVDGRGGGKPDMAMAGGKAVDKIPELMAQIPHLL